MKKISALVLLSAGSLLSACSGQLNQLFSPEETFAAMGQPDVKGVNATQEEMAKEAIKNGDYARAAQFYQQLVATEKGSIEQKLRYKLGLADAARRLGDTEAAVGMFDQLHKENPDNLDVAEGRGLSLMAAGKISDAGQAFSDVMEKDQKRWRTLNALGILFITKNMVPEASAYFAEAIAQSPDNPAVLNNAGLAFATDRNFSRGIEALQQASRVCKSPAQRKQIELNLAMVYGVSGDMDNAREVAGKYLEGPALDNNLGLYAHLAKDDALAKSYLNMALTQSPTYYERAWENLDALNNSGRSDSTDATPAPEKKPAARAALPKTETLVKPEASAEPAKESPHVQEKPRTEKSEKPAPTEKKNAKSASSTDVKKSKKATAEEAKPEAKKEKPANDDKSSSESAKKPEAETKPEEKSDMPVAKEAKPEAAAETKAEKKSENLPED